MLENGQKERYGDQEKVFWRVLVQSVPFKHFDTLGYNGLTFSVVHIPRSPLPDSAPQAAMEMQMETKKPIKCHRESLELTE